MSISVRRIKPEEHSKILAVDAQCFNTHLTEEIAGKKKAAGDPDRLWVAFDDERMIGTAMSFDFVVTLPGGNCVQCAGVSGVGVLPTDRRKGVFRMLMENKILSLDDEGAPISMLHSAQGNLYRRFGYGPATFQAKLTINVENGPPSFISETKNPGYVRLVSPEIARKLAPEVHEIYRVGQPGELARPESFWDDQVTEYEFKRDGGSNRFHVVHYTDDVCDGYLTYRISQGSGRPDVCIETFFATKDNATQEMWKYLLNLEMVRNIEFATAPADSSLPWLMTDSRRVKQELCDQSWVRLIKAPEALAARKYATDGRIIFRVHDSLLPGNNNDFALEVHNGLAQCELVANQNPDIELDIADLSSAFLGGMRFNLLARARRIMIHRPEALALADVMFASYPAPYYTIGQF